jgi:hypothetical protein
VTSFGGGGAINAPDVPDDIDDDEIRCKAREARRSSLAFWRCARLISPVPSGCSGMADKDEGADGVNTDRDERDEEVPNSGEGGSRDIAGGPGWSRESIPDLLRDRKERPTDPVSRSVEVTDTFAAGLRGEASA